MTRPCGGRDPGFEPRQERMIVKNKTKQIEIKDVILCNNEFSKIKGLMFKKKGRALLSFDFEKIYGIWMLFMRFSIDLAFIDKEKKIVDLKRNVPPINFNPKTWKTYYPKKKCQFILETEKGVLEKFEINDQLDFIFN